MVEQIERAIEVLRERGWTQGQFEDPVSGGVCAMGALNIAYSGDAYGGDLFAWRPEATQYIEDVLRRRGFPPYLQSYNDRYARSVEDVIDLLQCAVNHLRTSNFYLVA